TSTLAWDCWPGKPCTDGCVRGRAYWVAVNKYGACAATCIPWPCAGAEDWCLCGKTWLRILKCDATDGWTRLAQAYVVASLNSCNGACLPAVVKDALDE